MDFLKKFFPFSFKFETTKQVASIIFAFMGRLPFVGWVFSIANYATYLYCLGGIVLSILNKVGVIK